MWFIRLVKHHFAEQLLASELHSLCVFGVQVPPPSLHARLQSQGMDTPSFPAHPVHGCHIVIEHWCGTTAARQHPLIGFVVRALTLPMAQ